MNKTSKYSIIFLFMMIYWLPTAVQYMHHHENHFVCDAKVDFHFHKKQADCTAFHIDIPPFVYQYEFWDFFIPKMKKFQRQSVPTQVYVNAHSHHFLLRGPPYL